MDFADHSDVHQLIFDPLSVLMRKAASGCCDGWKRHSARVAVPATTVLAEAVAAVAVVAVPVAVRAAVGVKTAALALVVWQARAKA